MTRLRHYDHFGTARFITLSCYHNYNLFKTHYPILTFIKHLNRIREIYDVRLFGYVIMPNHVHLVVLPSAGIKLGRIIGELKSLTAREILAFWREKDYSVLNWLLITKDGEKQNVFWQRRFYDHNCRTKESVMEKIKYCHNNPVARGLVENPGDWRWSSYRWYQGLDGIAMEIDSVEL